MPLKRARRAAAVSAILLCFVAAACGTTVSLKDQGLAASQPGNQGGLGDNAGLGLSTPGSTAPGTTQLPAGTAAGTTVPSDTGFIPPGTSGSVRVPGVTATTIYVGAGYQLDEGFANSAAFGSSLNGGDYRVYYNIVIRDINKHGGIAGRKIVPVYHEFHAYSTQTLEQQYEAACNTWTKDNKYSVFAILDSGRPVVRECARKAGVAEFGGVTSSVPQTFRQYPNYVEISGLNMVREGNVTVGGLARQKYFDPGALIGIVTWDDSNHRTGVKDGYIRALRSRGLSLATEPAFIHVPESFQDLGATSADVSAAVLRFSTLKINHVLVLDGPAGECKGGCLTTLFLREAQSQNYHPRYGFNENNGPQGGKDEGLYPAEQLPGSVAVLWSDDEDTEDVAGNKNPARERCEALFKKNGLDIEGANENARANALGICAELWFMQAAAARMPGPLSVSNFMAGVDRLGYSFNDPTIYLAHFSPSQHDGIAAARNARYVKSCECYRFSGGVYRV
jgi:hypothetical protein